MAIKLDEARIRSLKITQSSASPAISFGREGWNYIISPKGSTLAFCPGSAEAEGGCSGPAARLAISYDAIIPGQNNGIIDFGSSTYKWKNIYANTLHGALIIPDVKGGTWTGFKTDKTIYQKMHSVSSGWASPLIQVETPTARTFIYGGHSNETQYGFYLYEKDATSAAWKTYWNLTNGELYHEKGIHATTFYGALSGNATSATKATQDGSGNTITSTYLKLSGGTMTGKLTLPTGADAYTNASLFFGTLTRIGTSTSNNNFGIYSTGKIMLRPNNGTMGYSHGVELSTTELIPTKNKTVTLGNTSHYWKEIYAVRVISTTASGGSLAFTEQRTGGPSVSFGVGRGNVNHGVYSDTLEKWIVYADASKIYLNGNADTATKLATARKLTIGKTDKNFDGSANVSWTTAEIGAVQQGTGADDVNTIYDTGVYNITSGKMTNGPTSYGYGQMLVLAYRKPTGNTKTDYATQIYTHGYPDYLSTALFYRTSASTAWNAWQMTAHGIPNTAVGSSTVPVYMTAHGAITAVAANSVIVNLASTSGASIYAASPRPGVTGTLPVANGGTGRTSLVTPTVTWTNGSSSGPTLTIKDSLNKSSTAVAIPAASDTISGIITTEAQTIVGAKTIDGIVLKTHRFMHDITAAAGWYRIAKLEYYQGYFNLLLFFHGGYNHGRPSTAVVHLSGENNAPSLKQIAGDADSFYTKVRLVGTSSTYYLEIYSNATGGSIGSQYVSFLGVGSISAVYTPTTPNGATSTYNAEISLKTMKDTVTFAVADNSATNTGAAVTYDSSSNITLKLPATIKASLTGNVTGNVSGSSGSCTGNAATATKMGVSTSWLYFQNSNELNFGGSNTSTTIYVGYRATDSRAIPTKFIFGGSTGTADLQAKIVYLGSGTSSYISGTQYTGNSATATKATQDGSGNTITSSYLRRYDWWTSGNGNNVDSLRAGITFAYDNHNAPTVGTIVAFDCRTGDGYTLQLMGAYNDTANHLYFRNRNGDSNKWGAWRTVLDDNNYTSYTVKKDGTGASGTWGINVTGSSGSCTGNAATASAWATARTLTLAGDLSGSVSIKGNAAMTLTATVKDDSHNHVISNVDGLQTALDNKAGGSNYIDIVVEGNANTYYPVVLSNIAGYYPMQFVNISRAYYETAPDTWNTATHKGGLTMTLLWNGSQYWDGNGSGSPCHCVYKYESYSTMVGGLGNSTSGIVVWLRGGTASYHIHCLNGKAMTATVYLSTFTDSANRSFAPKTTPDTIDVRWPGYAQNADYASSATALTSNAGSQTLPVYFYGGKPSAITALGEESTPLDNIWAKSVYITNTSYPAFYLVAGTKNSGNTYSRGVFEVNYTDSVGMWIQSDKTTDTKSRRALVLYGYKQKSDASQAIALRQCDTSGNWQSDLYVLHSGNYSSYALPKSGGTLTGKLQVNAPIFGYNYTNSNNAAAFIFDKPGSNYTGIGANGESNTIYFGPCNADGVWQTSPVQTWKFGGNISLSGTLKWTSALTKVTSPTVVAAFVNNDSANGLGYANASDLSVGYATKAAKDSEGNSIYNTYSKRYNQVIDLTGSAYNVNTWYPVYTTIPRGGLRRIACVCQLDTESVPSWSSHTSGFTRILEMLVTQSGWGATGAYSICLEDYTSFVSSECPVGYQQFTNSSSACFFCRGGGKYILETDWMNSWKILTASTTVSSQTIAPVTAYPGVVFIKSVIGADLAGNASTSITATSATKDGESNTIHSTYLKKSGGAVSGRVYSSATVAPANASFRNIKVVAPSTTITAGTTAIPDGEIWIRYE